MIECSKKIKFRGVWYKDHSVLRFEIESTFAFALINRK